MERKIGIYQIINNVNNHSYVGQSQDIYRRWDKHRSTAYNINDKSYDLPLYRAIRKYGLEQFSFNIIVECSNEELDMLEKYWIKEINPEYNLSSGGQNGSSSQKLTPAQVKEIQEILINDTEGRISHKDLAKKYGVTAEGTIRDINVGRSWFNSDLSYPLHKIKNKHVCCDCGQIISFKAVRCNACAHKLTYRAQHPDREELKQLIRTKSFEAIGRQFNVDGNSIRKWCDKYNLPRRKSDINNYSNEEWLLI